ncbi:O-antigen ligase family protein [Mucilaginibacter terrae]|uniref:O-antigen ligase family protein n=1 Tax=Mucilaginibacter terrae TaxID=1955052 RepID=UPI00363635E3
MLPNAGSLNFSKPVSGLFFSIITGLLICAGLVTSGALIYRSLTTHFLFIFLCAILFVCTGLYQIRSKQPILYSLPITITGILLFYTIYNSYAVSELLTYRHIYILCGYGLFIVVYYLFDQQLIRSSFLFTSMWAFASLEAFVCLLQYAGIVESLNSYFAVTGTWNNPNITAIFLAISIPSLIFVILNPGRIPRYIITISVLLIVLALFSLKCRTALLGAGLVMMLCGHYQYNIIGRLKAAVKKNNLILVGVVLLFITGCLFIYKAKQSSSDGRLFIWKLSLLMAADQPLTGYGYGTFERNYNLYQQHYIADGRATPKELRNAGNVNMAYNELFENLVEGGLIGTILIVALLVTLLKLPANILISAKSTTDKVVKQRLATGISSSQLAYAGIAAFILMGVTNFAIQAIPVYIIFLFYAGMLAANAQVLTADTVALGKTVTKNSVMPVFTGMIILLAGLIILYHQIPVAQAQLKNKYASELSKAGKFKQAETILVGLKTKLYNSEAYWRILANAQVKQKKYQAALISYKNAQRLTSNPDTYHESARCYKALGMLKDAEKSYLIAKNMEPTRFLHRYALMELYTTTGQRDASLHMADEILGLKAKVPSEQVYFYKAEARKLIGLRTAEKHIELPFMNKYQR